ncbi:EAL domain-containing protein (putative c-di-GMP-specific phosphodiesterase class I)/GGDEF domain-containing protein [Halomonas fontilapidosi]|uniref:EAL domain-containing protein (Putative c-di-GMP-specific phosphodiesterase class I)/GGDEF domain-containing protein n=1 Tax=Halomonas fontilapidosi TaxID=616675 RepID=A0A7W5DJ97_9GAMM|nr:EAL domain-containing protein [Halomonas fontilapidosi]MBB3183208.1 EAL domain-containing protein (putative c-di-GMP-specific phosphodiesterase class I)/GGDEF domain-containing protein [Halomonas fontilapidosi]
MSLIKQLWLTIVVILLLAFGGSLFIGVSASRAYIEQEVRIKNADNANALALTMSQMPKDPVTLELLVAAQFDTGHYRRIELRDPQGEIIEQRQAGEAIEDVPAWFVDLVRFEVPPSQAVVQDGWRQFGTLTLESQHSYAYRSLWRSSLELVGWFALAAVLSLILGGWLVRTIRRPLRNVVEQALHIGERRFTTIPAPRTRELREVVVAMNQLSAAVRDMLGEESEKLDQLRRRLQHDGVTGVLKREAFLAQLQIHLESQDSRASGTLALVRLARLADINEQLGHGETDALLHALASSLDQFGKVLGGGVVGRLNGSDFVLLLPGVHDLEQLQHELGKRLASLREQGQVPLGLPASLIDYAQGDQRGGLLASLDGALAAAETRGDHSLVIAQGPQRRSLFTSHGEWRRALQEAMAKGVYLAHYPVLDDKGGLLHFESPSRLRLNSEWQPAGVFMPWVSRLELDGQLDLAVIDEAVRDITQHGKPLGINLSAASIQDARFVMELQARLRARPDVAQRLWLEIPESLAIHDLASFRSLCRALQPLGCRIGLEHVGAEFTRIADLQDLGLAYLKIDRTLVQEVDQSAEQQTILRGMATLCHSLGILAIGEGIQNLAEARILYELGLDGATGPGIRQHDKPAG